MSVLLKVDNLTKAFGNKVVLDKISFDINSGEIFGIIGLSGSGKTTLLNNLVGYYMPEEGDVLLRTQNDNFCSLIQRHDEIKHFIGMAPQSNSFYPKLNVKENLDHFATLHGMPTDARKHNIDYLLKLVGLNKDFKTLGKDLSGGMQKRLGIACALIHRPKILFLDEPTADLDPVTRKQIWRLIKEVNDIGTTIIMASHMLEELEALCSRIAVLSHKKVQQIGTIAELKEDFSDKQEIVFESSPGRYEQILHTMQNYSLPIESLSDEGHQASIQTAESEQVLNTLLKVLKDNNETLLDVRVNKASLGQVFENLTKG